MIVIWNHVEVLFSSLQLQHNLNKLSDALFNVKDFVTSVDEANANVKRLGKIVSESEVSLVEVLGLGLKL